jgi:hypothetical protein
MPARKAVIAFVLIVIACGRRAPEVPENKLLLRIDGSWRDAGNSIRTASATILAFRSGGDFVEYHGWLLERPDTTLYLASGRPRVVIVGTWEQKDSEIKAKRRRVARSTPFRGARDPLCDQGPLTFRVSGNSVVGSAGEGRPGTYSPVTRLVTPDFEYAVSEAKKSQLTCGGE